MSQQIELRDSTGKLLGYFIPVDTADLTSRAAKVFDEEEGKRRFQAEHGQGKPLDDVLKEITGSGNKG